MDSKDDVIEQIKKVMRLANRAGTDGEKVAAESAMKRLAIKHGINLEEIKATDSDIKTEALLDGEWYTYPKTELGYITAVLRQHFGIVLIQHRQGSKVRFEWVGTKLNIDIAKHVTIILLRAVQKDWGNARSAKRLAKDLVYAPGYHDPNKQRALVALTKLNKRSFLDGWFWTIHQKLHDHPLRNDKEQLEAEKKSAEEMLSKMKEQHNIAEEKKNTLSTDRKSMVMGYEAAKKMNLSRPCEGNGYTGSPLALN